MDENIATVKPLTVQGTIQDNDILIYNCLELGNYIYSSLTNDNYLKEKTQNSPTCMLENLSTQNQNLKLLNELLNKIRANLLEEGGN